MLVQVRQSITVLLALFLLGGCRPKPGPVDVVADASAPVPRATAAADSGFAPARPSAHDVVDAWNQAHVKHDATALLGLYAPRVSFYGRTLTNRACANSKKAAFASDPSYTQSVRDVTALTLDAGASGPTVMRFTKTSTTKGKSTDYPSTLVVDASGLIVTETDAVTQQNLARLARDESSWCTDNEYPALDSTATGKLIPPFKVSSLRARQLGMQSKHFRTLAATEPDHAIVIDIIGCPTACDRAAKECGYLLRVADHSNIGKYASILVGWIYVDAIDGTVWDETESGWQSEPPSTGDW